MLLDYYFFPLASLFSHVTISHILLSITCLDKTGMKNSRPTVTVGIPAYNEEANIGRLLTTLSQQEETNFKLEKIIVVVDASSDTTEKIVRTFSSQKIKILTNKKRRGQIFSQNKIFSHTTSDIVVLLEADTYPQGQRFVHELLQPIITNPQIGLVHGNVQPLQSTSFVGKILERQVRSSHRYMIIAPDVEKWFSSGRGGRAFSKFVYTKLRWPSAVPEDVYAFLWCKKNDIQCAFQKTALSYYKTPQRFSDLLRERQKIQSGEKALKEHFPDGYFGKIYRKPRSYMLKPFLYFLFRYPLAFTGYCILKVRLYKNLTNRRFTDYWPTTYSTKLL